jgi:hypothetical protein
MKCKYKMKLQTGTSLLDYWVSMHRKKAHSEKSQYTWAIGDIDKDTADSYFRIDELKKIHTVDGVRHIDLYLLALREKIRLFARGLEQYLLDTAPSPQYTNLTTAIILMETVKKLAGLYHFTLIDIIP